MAKISEEAAREELIRLGEDLRASLSEKIVYIAGPMSGYPNFNYPAFHEAEDRWREKGFRVINPARTANGDQTKPYSYYMRSGIMGVLDSNSVAVLKGWQDSPGAWLEVSLAKKLEYPIYDAYTFEDYDESILEEAERIVSGNRQNNYGHPADNFSRVGRIWGAILNIPSISPENVGLMLTGLKVARESFAHSRDNLVDIAGYVRTVDLVISRKEGENGS